ncbi:MAG TPA: GNAT family N-acetyltransferase [Polyangiales bacterium]
MPIQIRPYQASDRAAVRHVCCETGYLGNPIEPVYRDRPSFADLITRYYTDHEPESALVVDVDGKVVGYLLGCLDSTKAFHPERIALEHVLKRGVCFRPGTAGFYWRSLRDVAVDTARGAAQRHQPDLGKWPGHTHFSVLPEARNLPVVPGLFRQFFKLARERGCHGVHGEVFVENERAMAMHKALGFSTHGVAWPVPGMRTPSGARMHVQFWTRTTER